MHLYGSRRSGALTLAISAAAFLLVLALLFLSLGKINRNTDDKQLKQLETAIQNACVTCFAVEGRYPPNVSYLADHYGVTIDETRYIVQYDRFADNVIPQIAVLVRGEN